MAKYRVNDTVIPLEGARNYSAGPTVGMMCIIETVHDGEKIESYRRDANVPEQWYTVKFRTSPEAWDFLHVAELDLKPVGKTEERIRQRRVKMERRMLRYTFAWLFEPKEEDEQDF